MRQINIRFRYQVKVG